MRRAILTGTVCLAAGYAAAATLPHLAKDIGRYNKIRAMSDQGTLLTSVLQNLPALAGLAYQTFNGSKGKDGKDQSGIGSTMLSLLPSLAKDIARYQKIRAM